MHNPPRADRRRHVHERVTGNVEDPYAWLINKDDPDTVKYLTEENEFWADWSSSNSEQIEAIFQEIRSRTKEDDSTPPIRRGPYWYSSRTETGQSYAIHSRGNSLDAAFDVVILDENIEATHHEYFSVGAFDVSPNHQLLAWSRDTDGSERYEMHIRDLNTLADTSDVLTNTSWGGTAWSEDNSYFFYVVPDDAMRPWQVWRHKVGTAQADDVKVFEESDERLFVSIDLSRSGKFIIIDIQGKTTSEVRIIPADSPTELPRVFTQRRDNIEYSVDHWGDQFVVVSNLDAEDFQVFTCPLGNTTAWSVFVEHVPGQRITQWDSFDGFSVLQRWVDGQQQLSLVAHDGSRTVIHVLDEPHEVELDSNPEYETDTIRITYQSLSMPATIAEVHAKTLKHTVLKRIEVPTVDLSNYVSSRQWVTAADGARIPLDLIHHRDTALDGTAPVLLYGYGSYEISLPPWFSAARLSLLDRGWVWALTHPRGGGELGRSWYTHGKLEHKRNTFTDTIACAQYLPKSGLTSAHVVLRGGSAGGLLVGACMNITRNAFAGFIAEVPFVDVVNTMSDPSLPLTITEWEEWGDPRKEPFASYMLSYSPYDNVTSEKYPPLYVTAGLNDPRVSYHEPAKWVAKIRHDSPQTFVLMKCDMGAGHGGPSGRYDRWREEAQTLTFALSTVSTAPTAQ